MRGSYLSPASVISVSYTHLSEMCDFMETYSVLIFSIVGSVVAVFFFYKNKLKTPLQELKEMCIRDRPNVVLLIPIADILDVTVTELLRGEKIDTQKNIDTKEVEELVVGSLDMAVRNSIHQHRKNWILAYLLCFLISITEIIMLVVSGNSIAEMKDDILLVTGLMLLFGAWFCFFAKDILPTYYDANKINYVSQGIFRIHLVGLSFNNGNWMYICTTLKIWTLATVVLYPLAGIIIINCLNIALWDILSKIFLIMILGGMVVSIYIIGKKYE